MKNRERDEVFNLFEDINQKISLKGVCCHYIYPDGKGGATVSINKRENTPYVPIEIPEGRVLKREKHPVDFGGQINVEFVHADKGGVWWREEPVIVQVGRMKVEVVLPGEWKTNKAMKGRY